MGVIFRSVINLFLVFIIIQCIELSSIGANPIDKNLENAVTSKQQSEPTLAPSSTQLEDNADEDLETANSMVFRPLFVYRQQQAGRRRIYEKKQEAPVRRTDPEYYYPYGYPSYGYPYYRPIKRRKPVRKEPEFPALF